MREAATPAERSAVFQGLRASLDDLNKKAGPTKKYRQSLDNMANALGESERAHQAALEELERLRSQAASPTTTGEQEPNKNWQFAKQYGLPALTGLLGVAAGGALLGGADRGSRGEDAGAGYVATGR